MSEDLQLNALSSNHPDPATDEVFAELLRAATLEQRDEALRNLVQVYRDLIELSPMGTLEDPTDKAIWVILNCGDVR